MNPVAWLELPCGVQLHHLRIALDGRPNDGAYRVLDASERDRAERFHRNEDRQRFMQTRVALRRLLGERLAMDPAAVAFITVGRGRPVLAGSASSAGLHFSVSHAGEHAMVALADRPLGVDVEIVRSEAWSPTMAALVLSADELGFIAAEPEPDLAFFRCWTRKEAYVKTGHQGLSDGLRNVSLTPGPGPAGYLIVDRTLEAGVHVACAVKG